MTGKADSEGISITWRGRRITRTTPGLAAAAAALLAGGALLLVYGLLSPALLPIHAVLRLAGRRGFAYRDTGGRIAIDVSSGAFRPRRESR